MDIIKSLLYIIANISAYMEAEMKLGEKMKMLREMHDLTQVELAKQAGVTQAYVARIESNKVKNPKVSGLAGLSRALGVPVEVLLDEKLSLKAWQHETDVMKIDNAAREMLRLYRALSTREQSLATEFIRLLWHRRRGRPI